MAERKVREWIFRVLHFLLVDVWFSVRVLVGIKRWHGCLRDGDCRAHPHPDHVRDLLDDDRRRLLVHTCSTDCYPHLRPHHRKEQP